MSQLLYKHKSIIKKLHKASRDGRRQLLCQCMDKDFINVISECCRNILCGNVPLTVVQKEKIGRRKALFRKIALKKTSLKEKKRIVQSGGFLGALLGPIVSVIGSLFGLAPKSD